MVPRAPVLVFYVVEHYVVSHSNVLQNVIWLRITDDSLVPQPRIRSLFII